MIAVVVYVNLKDVIALALMALFLLFLGVLWVLDALQNRRRRIQRERAAPDPECSDCHVSHFTQDGKHRSVRGPL